MDIGEPHNNAYIFDFDGKDWKQPIEGKTGIYYQNEDNHYRFYICYVTPKKNRIWITGNYMDGDEEQKLKFNDSMVYLESKSGEKNIPYPQYMFEWGFFNHKENHIKYDEPNIELINQFIINEMNKRDGKSYTTIKIRKKRTIEEYMENTDKKLTNIENMLYHVFTHKQKGLEMIDCLRSIHSISTEEINESTILSDSLQHKVLK